MTGVLNVAIAQATRTDGLEISIRREHGFENFRIEGS